VEKTPAQKRPAAEAELIFARAARLHFKSVANQTRFILARDALADTKNPLSQAQRRSRLDEIERIVKDEVALAREMFTLTRLDSILGFESFCQYFYLPLDLVEKVVNCRYVLDSYAAEGR